MMKNKFYTILVALVAVTGLFASCSKDDDSATLTTIGFAEERFSLDIENEATLRIVSTAAMSSGKTVPFTVTSNLVEGEDYELSTDKFTFAEGAREAQVTVTLLKDIADEDALEFSLNPVEFGTLGLSKATIGMSNADVILYTFDKPNYTMTNAVDVTLQLDKITGSFTAEKAITIEVEVDTEQSTAVEGTHFSFANGNTITIPAGQSKGVVKLNLIKQEAGKDQITLRLRKLPIVFKPGNYDQTSVVVFGPSFEKLMGSWKFVAFTNTDFLELNTSYMGDDPNNLPMNNTEKDILTFDEEGLKVSLTGDLKNYFREGKVTYIQELENYVLQERGLPATRVNLDVVQTPANVLFSATEENVRDANVGYRVFVDDNDGKEYLEVTIHDYEPADFLKNTFATAKAWNEDPVMYSYPLRFHFEKVE